MGIYHPSEGDTGAVGDRVIHGLTAQTAALESGPKRPMTISLRKSRPNFGEVMGEPGNQISGNLCLDRLAGFGLCSIKYNVKALPDTDQVPADLDRHEVAPTEWPRGQQRDH